MWTSGSVGEGVVLRKAYKAYVSCPAELRFTTGGLFDAACELNVKVVLQLLDICPMFVRYSSDVSLGLDDGKY